MWGRGVRYIFAISFALLMRGTPSYAQQSDKFVVRPRQAFTNTGIHTTRGYSYEIYAKGSLNWQTTDCKRPDHCMAGPNGFSAPCPAPVAEGYSYVSPKMNCFSLIAKIGEQGSIIFVGEHQTIRADADGELLLGINDAWFSDNADGWEVTVVQWPRVVWQGMDITDTKQSVTAGQRVALTAVFASPVGVKTRSLGWTLPPNVPVVGGYEVARGSKSARTVQAKLDSEDNELYFLEAGKAVLVKFMYTLQDGRQLSAQATFDIAGPTMPTLHVVDCRLVSVRDGLLQFGNFVIQSVINGKPKTVGTPGITFDGSVVPPVGIPGTLQWVQLVENEITTVKRGKQPEVCHGGAALDETYPFDRGSKTFAAPYIRLTSEALQEAESLTARTYLLWVGANPDSIPVPLGFVRWGWSGEVARRSVNAKWPKTALGSAWNDQPVLSHAYPEWGKVRIAGGCGLP